MSDELKSCPFCGEKAHLEKNQRAFVNGISKRVACVRCPKCGIYGTKIPLDDYGCTSHSTQAEKRAVELWNRRKDVRHGEWIDVPLNSDSNDFANKYNLRTKCSVCGYAMSREYPLFNYCPHCGAKMDKEAVDG